MFIIKKIYRILFTENIEKIKGYVLLIRILKKHSNKAIIINWYHIGDICYTMAYMREFVRQYKVKKVVIFAKGKAKGIADSYNISELDIDEEYDNKDMHNITAFFLTRPGRAYYRKLNAEGKIYNLMDWFYTDGRCELYRIPDLHWLDLIKYVGLNLKKESLLEHPHINEVNIDNIIKKYNINNSKSILLNPYTQTVSRLSDDFWKKIVQRIKALGFQVFTSTDNINQEPIEGSVGITTTLEESYYLAEQCRAVIGLRSGWFDYISGSKAKILCVYNIESKLGGYMKYAWSLKGWGKNDAIEFYYEHSNEDKIIDEIIKAI